MNKYIILILYLGLFMRHVFAEDKDKYIVTCPAIEECKPGDGPKKNQAYSKINQQAYDCFRTMGQTDLANQAFTTKTKCLAIYGSTTATIGADNQAIDSLTTR